MSGGHRLALFDVTHGPGAELPPPVSAAPMVGAPQPGGSTGSTRIDRDLPYGKIRHEATSKAVKAIRNTVDTTATVT